MPKTETKKQSLSDANYIREMFIVHPKCPETDMHNERLEEIALRLEEIDG